MLDEIGIEGQEKILAGRALVIGAGGLGCPASLYLASAGVGRICIADDDTVDATNLQRQILHRTDSVGSLKVLSAQQSLLAINPEVVVVPLEKRMNDDLLQEEVEHSDVVLDCCDNFATRHAVNRACVYHKKPLVSGAAIRFDAQISVFDLRQTGAPCYNCLFPEEGEAEDVRCAEMGVFAPITGIIGAMQAAEGLKLLANTGESLQCRLLLLDARAMRWRDIDFDIDQQCKVCGNKSAVVS